MLGLSSLKFRATTQLTQTVKKPRRLKGLIEKTKDEMFTNNIMVIYLNKGSDCKDRNYISKCFSGYAPTPIQKSEGVDSTKSSR